MAFSPAKKYSRIFFSVTDAFTAVNPFKIPKEKYDDFMSDYLDILKDLQIMTKYNNNYETSVQFRYRLLVIYARKPASQDKLLAELHKQH